jgi:NitT/TauT family transport system substrate-binding protein
MQMMKTFSAAMGFAIATLISMSPVHAQNTVTVGTVGSPSANLWPLFIGIDKGFFTAEKVKVDLIYIPASANAIQQLAAGSLDMSFSTGLVDPIRAVEQGAGLGIARFEIQAPPYALIAKSSIKSLKDLKGKVISVGGPKDITRIYVDRMLAPHGLKTGDYDYVYAGATTARAQALLSGAVDAAILLPPSNFQLQNQGFNDLGLTIEYAPELAFSGTMANKAWAAQRREYITLLGGAAAAWPLVAVAQEPGRTYRLGSLHLSPRDAPHHIAFFDELRRLGFIEGQNLAVDARGYGLRIEQLAEHAAKRRWRES